MADDLAQGEQEQGEQEQAELEQVQANQEQAEGNEEEGDVLHYRAFISYRHTKVDSEVAEAVQHGLERFWVPKAARGADGSAHIAPVFRDKEELPVSSRLGDDIEAALRGSDALIVICSPRTSESEWIAREIDTFLKWHPIERVFVVLAEGASYEVIPERLRYKNVETTGEDGEKTVVVDKIEPLACDFRDPSRSARRMELTRLAAGILEVSFDSLMRRAQRRRMRIIGSIAAAVTTVALGIAAYALWSNARIAESYRLTQINESEALAVEAQELYAQGDRMEAIQVALAALPESSTSGDRPFVPAAQIALQDAVQVYPNSSFWHSCYALSDVSYTCAVSEDGLLASEGIDGSVQVYDFETGAPVSTIDVATAFGETGAADYSKEPVDLLFCSEGLVISTWNTTFGLFDPRSGELLWRVDSDKFSGSNIAVSNDGSLIAVGWRKDEEVTVEIVDAAQGSTVETHHLAFTGEAAGGREYVYRVRLAFSPDDTRLAVTCSDTAWLLERASGASKAAHLACGDANSIDFFEDLIVCIGSESWSKSLYLGTAFFDVFSADLEPLWSKAETPPTYYDEVGVFHSNYAFVAGRYDDEEAGRQLAYVTGDTVKIVDQATGELTRSVQKASPVRACAFDNGDLHTIDYKGEMTTVFMSRVRSEELLALSSVNVGKGEYATIQKVGDWPYALVWDSTFSKTRVYRFGPRLNLDESALSEVTEGFQLDAYGMPVAPGDVASPLYFLDGGGTMLRALDNSSFEQLWTINLTDLGLGDDVRYAPTTKGALFAYSRRPVDGVFTVLELSEESAEVLDRYTYDADESGWFNIEAVDATTIGGQRVLMVRGNRDIIYTSCETHEDLGMVGHLDYPIDGSRLTKDAVIVMHSEEGREHLELFSVPDGAPLDGEVESLLVADGASAAQRSVVSNGSGTALAICCADGFVRCVSASDWIVLWEQRMPDAWAAAFSADGSLLIVQDSSGTCFLLSAATGEVLRSSSVQLPPLSSFWLSEDDPQTLYALSMTLGLNSPETSLVVLSLDEEAFGPTAVIYGGAYYAAESNQVLLCDPLFQTFNVCPLYSLDELIEKAHEITQGHELTDAERQRYRIAG